MNDVFEEFAIPPMPPARPEGYEPFNYFTGTPAGQSPDHDYRPRDIIAYDADGTPRRFRVMAIVEDDADINATLVSACPLGRAGGGVITPGWVIGGGKSIFLEPKYSGSEDALRGRTAYFKFTWTAQEIDGVLQAGGEMGDTITVHSASSVPDDKVPTINDLSGVGYYPLVAWDDDGNQTGSGCGTITIDFCPGGFIKTRP